MRNISADSQMTFDGHAEFPIYPGSDVRSTEPDPSFVEMWIDHFDSIDTVILGRKALERQRGFWASDKSTPSDPPFGHEYSTWKDRGQRMVFSHRTKKSNWQNPELVSGDITRIVSRLKRSQGKGIVLDGEPSLVREFMKRGLIDDQRVVVFPVILGKGQTWFGPMAKEQTSKLLS
jgi:dihydrofolate reductase